jgi:cation:H+ antiporter
VVLVSFGTSLPELATGVISKVRGHAELGLGAVLGSNIFNVGFIVAVAAMLSPIDVDRGDVWVSIFLGAAMLPVLFVHTGERLSRWRGLVLLGIYFTGMAVLIALET